MQQALVEMERENLRLLENIEKVRDKKMAMVKNVAEWTFVNVGPSFNNQQVQVSQQYFG